ncbi:hypothetical protein DB88DRAFT_542193 [Papiliotrema laurentii]|uniref:R3H-associated N-terminal domain-containing protein n=1 Tax=Papiliotrema laurentii TaxID=5418 RepID=A0AAD9CUH9_PAPLA|nr:hypothetical protein DB88DRAFT_542193 [Papiliotrema laurentii]
MTDTASPTQAPVPLHIPAILQNPVNRSARQVEAYNAQQRQKAAARRESRAPEAIAGNGRGKRYVRRKDNAAFTSNPHIVQPTRADFTPPVPLQVRRAQPMFPPSSIPRSTEAPGSVLPSKDPFSQDSRSGAFSTSLKGTRALLRKKGRRAEELVGTVESGLREWLQGEGWDLGADPDHTTWNVIDPTPVDYMAPEGEAGPSSSRSGSRRMPERHQLRDQLPPLPVEDGSCPAILELSRSPAHLTWAVTEGFERLVVHLVVRYYELVSWSEDHHTTSGQSVRVTHIILPTLAQPRVPLQSHSLLTPVTTDLSASSGSELYSSTDVGTDSETDSDAGTEVGYSLEFDHEGDTSIATVTPELIQGVSQLELNDLHRVSSNTSSMYASSEGGSDFGMADSVTLPLPPSNAGWTPVTFSDVESDFGDIPLPKRNIASLNALGRMGPRGWEDRPTFFEYLYGV